MKIIILLLLPTMLFAQNVTEPPKFEIRSLKEDSDTLKVRENFKDLYANKQNVKNSITNNDNSVLRVKKLTGTTAGAEGGTTSVAHGLTGAKIIGYIYKLEYAANSGTTVGDPTPGYKSDCYHDATNFFVRLHATESENILSKPFIVTIFYEE